MKTIKLINYTNNGGLFARSLAKRILTEHNITDATILDFNGIDFVAPSFADELFRVSQISFEVINVSEGVQWAIKRVQR